MERTNFLQANSGRLAAGVAVVFWAAGNVMVASFDLPGMQIAFWRLLLGACVYGVVMAATGRRVTWATVRLVALPGMTVGLEIAIFFTALKNTTVVNATIIGTLQPIVLLAVASRRFQEQVTGWLFGASLVALGGVALVILGASSEVVWSPWGDFLALVAMLLFSAYFVFVKNVRGRVDTLTLPCARHGSQPMNSALTRSGSGITSIRSSATLTPPTLRHGRCWRRWRPTPTTPCLERWSRATARVLPTKGGMGSGFSRSALGGDHEVTKVRTG